MKAAPEPQAAAVAASSGSGEQRVGDQRFHGLEDDVAGLLRLALEANSVRAGVLLLLADLLGLGLGPEEPLADVQAVGRDDAQSALPPGDIAIRLHYQVESRRTGPVAQVDAARLARVQVEAGHARRDGEAVAVRPMAVAAAAAAAAAYQGSELAGALAELAVVAAVAGADPVAPNAAAACTAATCPTETAEEATAVAVAIAAACFA